MKNKIIIALIFILPFLIYGTIQGIKNTENLKNTAIAVEKYTNSEKYLLAFSLSPSPIVLATRALPPVPNMNPIAPRIIRYGMMKLTAANGPLPAKLEMKKPSTTP